MTINFVYDDLVDYQTPIPNGIDKKQLKELFKSDIKTFRKYSPLRSPCFLNLPNVNNLKIDKNSKGIYPLAFDSVDNSIDEYQIRNLVTYGISDLAKNLIYKEDLKLIVFTKEPISKKSIYCLYNTLKEAFKKFIIYSDFIPQDDMRDHLRYNLAWENYTDINHYEYARPYTQANDKINNKKHEKLIFGVPIYTNNLFDFRAAAAFSLMELGLEKNCAITFKRIEIWENYTRESSTKMNKIVKSLKSKYIDKMYKNLSPEDLFIKPLMNLVIGPYMEINNMDGVDYPCLADKIFKPIKFKLPFLCIAQKDTLKELKKRGYKTFHPFINESYDSINNNDDRLFEVINQVNHICNLSDHDLNFLFEKIRPIVDYNYENFKYRVKSEIDYLSTI